VRCSGMGENQSTVGDMKLASVMELIRVKESEGGSQKRISVGKPEPHECWWIWRASRGSKSSMAGERKG